MRSLPQGLRTFLLLAALAALACAPLYPKGVPVTPMTDLPNHVRHVYDYELALREGQFPPIVAPELNESVRGPLFQYYGGTAYLVPGVVSLLGINSYRALAVSVFLHVLAAGACMYGACRALGVSRPAAVVAAVAFQLFPFAGTDLYTRGGYTQVTALWCLPVVFYFCLMTVRSRGAAAVANFCLAALAWALFIPQHPIQTIVCGCMMLVLLAAYVLVDIRRPWPGLFTPALSMLCGLVVTTWFWYPIVRDYGRLKVVSHAIFLDAGLEVMEILLWPGFREGPSAVWAPQLGLHFVIAAVLALVFWKRAGAIGVGAALSVFAFIVIIGWHSQMPWVEKVLSPLQWSYRLLIPAALAGALCVAFAFEGIYAKLGAESARGVLFGLALGFLIAIAPPYFAAHIKYPRVKMRDIRRPYVASNSLAYALRGTDFRDLLSQVAPQGALRPGADVPVPLEGYPFEARLVLKRQEGMADPADVRVVIDGAADRPGVEKLAAGEVLNVTFRLKPPVGHLPGDRVLRLDATPGVAWRVQDASFRVDGDPPDAWIRVPTDPYRRQRRKRTMFAVGRHVCRAGGRRDVRRAEGETIAPCDGRTHAGTRGREVHMDLTDRSAIITGANQGLGKAIAAEFVRAGAGVLLTARNEQLLRQVRDELRPLARPGRPVEVMRADVAEERDCRAVAERATQVLPDLAVLVNNAGVYGPKGLIEDVDWGEWVKAMQINLFGTVLMCRAVIPLLRRRGYGKIVNLSGGGATAPLPRISAYAASKAAVVRMTDTLAEELKDARVDVNAIAPGALNTRLLDEVLEAGPEKVGKQFYERSLKQQKEGGAPFEKGAKLAVFLASSASDGITGRLLSAVWDDWQNLPSRRAELAKGDVYTLRRIVPEDRGMKW
jgi:NAD(P)-dependent dehydrogenase (short-subunit alcohol dehydrogenase family)